MNKVYNFFLIIGIIIITFLVYTYYYDDSYFYIFNLAIPECIVISLVAYAPYWMILKGIFDFIEDFKKFYDEEMEKEYYRQCEELKKRRKNNKDGND